MFTVALIHGGFSILQFHSLGSVNPFVSLFTSNTQYNNLPGFPFQSLGFFALVILMLMAATSHDFWLHNLSPKTWKALHMMVYLAYFLIILHVLLGALEYETNPVLLVLLAAGAVTLITLHIAAAYKEIRKDNITYTLQKDGFVQVCRVDDIEESKARVFCIDAERIAVFKTQGRLFAVHNVCKHQLGPLGEGKIIDGCITCPWHGYQYLPNNGQSPPPFKEKVSTYDVKVEDGKVWVNPKPYPEGTERPGAETTG
jgi:nitrite reductase/ring-hydroxylating ferredoxin subunit